MKIKREMNGLSKTRIAGIYYKMIRRCSEPKDARYNRYGGRGIKVCNEWTDSDTGFINFYKWALFNGYDDELTIDRINNDGDYEPSNCRWITNKEQQRNKSVNHFVNYNGNSMVATDVASELGISLNALLCRLKKSDDEDFIFHKGVYEGANRRNVIRYSPDGSVKKYISIKEASIDCNIPSGNIVKVCKGERNKAGGFVFRYAD